MSLLAVGVSHQTAPVALLEQFAMGPDDRVKALHELVGERPRQRGAGARDVQPDRGLRRGREVPRRRHRRQPGARPPGRRDGRGALPVRHRPLRGPGRRAPVHRRRRAWTRWSSARPRCSASCARPTPWPARRAPSAGRCTRSPSGRCGSASGCTPRPASTGPAPRWSPSPSTGPRSAIGSLDGRSVAGRRRRVHGRAGRHDARPPRAPTSSSAAAPRRTPRGWPTASAAAPRRSATCRRSWPPPTCWSPAPARPASWWAPTWSPRAMAGAHGRPLVVVDLALPRDVDPGVAALPGVHVVDLALLQGERASTPGRPTAGPVAADDIAAAHALVETETALLRAERQAAEVAPTVSALRSQAAEVVDAELLRLSAPAARPRRPRPRRDRPHRAPGRRQAAARADRAGEGTGRDAGRRPTTPVPCARSSAWASTPPSTPRTRTSPRPSRSTPSCDGGGVMTAAHRHRDPAPGHAGQRAGPHPVAGRRRRDHRGHRHPGRAGAHRHRGRPVVGGDRRSSAARACSSRRSADALLEPATVDLAVHSYKDLPTAPQPGLDPRRRPRPGGPARRARRPRRAHPRRAAARARRSAPARPRRVAQLRALGLGLDIVPIRGNVDTRLGAGGGAGATSTPSCSPAPGWPGWAGST